MKKLLIFFITAVLIVSAGFILLNLHDGQSTDAGRKKTLLSVSTPGSLESIKSPKNSQSNKKKAQASDNADVGNNDNYNSRYGALPALLAGTSPDGEIVSDTEGRLVISESIRQRFDYFLSAVSVEGLETCIGRIEENIEKTLPPEAKEQALNILTAYINYKKSIYDLHKKIPSLPASGGDDISKIREIFENRNTMRREHFSEDVADAFFGAREVYDSFGLRRLEIHYDKSLSDSEKQVRIAGLEKEMPERMRERYERERKLKNSYIKP